MRVINNADSDSGGRDGLLALVAFAVVLFFVIRIYSDYVTATGQAVKPGTKKQTTSYAMSQRDSGVLDQSDRAAATQRDENSFGDSRPQPTNPRYSDEEVRHPRTRPANPPSSDEEDPDTRARPVKPPSTDEDHGGAGVEPDRGLEASASRAPGAAAEQTSDIQDAAPRQTAAQRRRNGPVASSFGRTIATRSRLPAPPEPQVSDESDSGDSRATLRTALAPLAHRKSRSANPGPSNDPANEGAVLARSARTTLFHGSTPYPGSFDDIQIGDRLSELANLRLPRGRISHSLYSYHPTSGPFKTIYAMLAIGPSEPVVTGVAYVFRNADYRDEVRRQAIAAFGEGDITDSGDDVQRKWRHWKGYTIAVDRERLTIDQDMTRAGRRYFHRSSAGKP